MLVKAVAHESQCILFSCSASSMTSKWVGEGEKLVRTLFRMAADVAPSIIFLDEIDSLLGRRKSDNSEQESSRRFKTEFMVQMDGVAAGGGDSQNKMLLIGCTNCPWDIDDAVMRRFSRRIYVPLPDRDARKSLWKKLLVKAGMKDGGVDIAPKDVERLIKISEDFSCSDISSIANEAAFGPLREFGIETIKDVKAEDIRPIKMKDFESAIESTKKSVSSGLLQRYKKWEADQASTR
jgi:SpoVK/Ycf46/Vps4 family AAA+-type ATPase